MRSPNERPALPSPRTLVLAVLVALATGLATVPRPWATRQLPPDSLEILAIANAWVGGAGFVDPVKWNFYQTTGVPFPAFSLRPPVAIALAAVPLALDGDVADAIVAHAALASVIAGAVVLLAPSLLSLPAAVTAALVLGLSPAWARLAQAPMSDVPAVGAFLLVVALAPSVPRSWPAAIGGAVLTIGAWATRPNLLLLAPLLLAAVAWQSGWRAAASRRCLGYAGLTTLGLIAVRSAVAASTGSTPYAGYGFMAEILHPDDPLDYGKTYVGALGFVLGHAQAVAATCATRLGEVASTLLFSPPFLFTGWLLLPGAAYCLLQRGGSIGRRLIALGGIAFLAVAVLTYCCFAARYLVLPMVCAVLCAACALDDAAAALAARRREKLATLLRAGTILLVVGLLGATALRDLGPSSLAAWSHYLRGGTLLAPGDDRGDADDLRRLCARLEAGAIVATPRPWTVHAWCGNPSVMLARDLDDPARRAAFFARERAGYVIAERSAAFAWLPGWSGAQRVASGSLLTLYRVGGERDAAGWQAPQPLLCAGRGASCARALRR